MIRKSGTTCLALALCASLSSTPMLAAAEDIDIFTGGSAGTAINPRILIVLDNTSNWSRQAQKWPDGATQGQSEVAAIKAAIATMDGKTNVGLMEFVTGGDAKDMGGFIRAPVLPMDTDNKALLTTELDEIYGLITSPGEKRNSNTAYGDIMYDAYNYFSGGSSVSPDATSKSKADVRGYTSADFTRFKAPIDSDSTCGKGFVIFIGNSDQSGPMKDTTTNTTSLNEVNDNWNAAKELIPVTQLGLPDFTVENVTVNTNVGLTQSCYADAAAAKAELTSFATACGAYTQGCSIGQPAPATAACAPGTKAYTVVQSVYTPASSGGGTTTTTTTPGLTTGYYSLKTDVPATDRGGMTCPTASGNVTYACTWTVGDAVGSAEPLIDTATTSACFTGTGTASGAWDPATATDKGGLVCPANAICSYKGVEVKKDSCAKNTHQISVTQTAIPKRQFAIERTLKTTTGSGGSPATTVPTALGMTSQCYASAPTSTSDFTSACTGTNISCSYQAPTADTINVCPIGTNQFRVVGTDIEPTNTPTGTTVLDKITYNADEWARLLFEKGVPVYDNTGKASKIRPSISTYTIDVYNAQPNAVQTSLLLSMAKAGGGKYFAATNQQEITDALKQIVSEIQAVNSTFASTSLPVNATNRSQSVNQVYIGMFRPDPNSKPRWPGNLKRYKLMSQGAGIELADALGKPAVNTNTGFITDCAQSFWTSDSGNYWSGMGIKPAPISDCPITPDLHPYSDAPDGPLVEKGGASQILRKGNTAGDWDTSKKVPDLVRTVYTHTGKGLEAFTETSAPTLSANLINFISGKDVYNERLKGETAAARPSIHGDVIHSRPLPVNYGTDGVTVYYGANDGLLHAVNAETGVERWSFVAPEFYSRLDRIELNTTLINYPNATPDPDAEYKPKDYYFDGSIGLYQNLANSKIHIYPTMRRGGRMIYGLDVTKPGTPSYLWKAGCPNLGDNAGCTSGMEGIGQTWSTPKIVKLKGYTDNPVVVIGGGYDGCEDANTKAPDCSKTKGGHVYVLDAITGTRLATLSTNARGIAADVALLDINSDGYVDYGYAADIGGALYRIEFVAGPGSLGGLAKEAWSMHKVAFTEGAGRKFLFGPALVASAGKAYLAIGSGDREHPLETQYPYADVVNRFYVYKDDLSKSKDADAIDLDKTLVDYTEKDSCDTPKVLPSSSLQGWFINLNKYGQGEQTVTSALIVGGMVTFNTNRPLAKGGTCSTTLGEAGGYWVNLFNAAGAIGVEGTCGGDRRSVFVGGGLPPSAVAALSVLVDGKHRNVVIGAPQKDGSRSSQRGTQEPKLKVENERKRSYTNVKTE